MNALGWQADTSWFIDGGTVRRTLPRAARLLPLWALACLSCRSPVPTPLPALETTGLEEVTFQSDLETEFTDQDGRTVHVSPGAFRGLLGIRPPREIEGKNYEEMAREVMFVFRGADGACYRHWAILRTEDALWIEQGMSGHYSRDGFRPDVELMAYPVNRERGEPVLMSDGPAIRTFFHEAAIGFQVAIGPGDLDVKARFTDEDGADTTIYYRVPIARLLWRRAPLPLEGDYEFQGAAHVMVEGPFATEALAKAACPVSVTAAGPQ